MNENTSLEKPQSLKSLLEQPAYSNRFKQILGERAAQFMASLIQVGSSGALAKCDPNSVIAAAITATALDLPIDKNLGFAHIVPYKDKAAFQLGWKGLVQLALRSGQYSGMNAKPINAEALGGFDSIGDPIILWDKIDETKPEIGYAFAFKMVNGFSKTNYWPKEKAEAHARKYSKSYAGGYDSVWKSNFTAMGLKTVIKDSLSKWATLSVQMQKALIEDSGARKSIDAEIEYPDNEVKAVVTDAPPIEIEVEKKETAKEPPKDQPTIAPFTSLQNKIAATEGTSEAKLLAYLKSVKKVKDETKILALVDDKILKEVDQKWDGIKELVKAVEV